MKKGLQQFNMSSGTISFPAHKGKCKVVINSRFLLTSVQIEKIKESVEYHGFETRTNLNTLLVQISLFLIKWFPKEYNHVTVNGNVAPMPITHKDCLTITIS